MKHRYFASVNKLAKGFLLAFAALILLALLAVMGINLYVESQGVQARLETALSRELRMPVKLTRLRFSLWGGLKVAGLTVPAPEEAEKVGPEGVPFLKAPEISARIALRPLLSRRLVVRELVISSPSVVWVQTRKGKWRLPEIEGPSKKKEKRSAGKDRARGRDKAPKVAGQPGSPDPSRAPAAAPAENKDAPVDEAREPSKKVEFQIVAARIENATFQFLDREGKPLAVFEEVTVNCPSAAIDQASGMATIRRLTLHDRIVIENIVTPFEYSEGRLSLPQLDAQLAGGTIQGSYQLHPEQDDAPFLLDLRLEGVDLNRLLTDLGADGTVQKSEGRINGSLNLHGDSGRSKTLKGLGRLALAGGRMEQYPLLQSIGMALQIDELTRLELQQAVVDFRVGENKVYIDSLVLQSANLSLSAEGETRFDGKLDLAARLAVNQKISRQIPNWIDSNFGPVEGSDQRLIKFGISGTLESPETDLMRVMVGEKLEKQAIDLIHAFRSLTGGGKKKKKTEKSEKGERKAKKSAPSAPDLAPDASGATPGLLPAAPPSKGEPEPAS